MDTKALRQKILDLAILGITSQKQLLSLKFTVTLQKVSN